jgi:glycosyltransferase involved in cell wall biosynthesis
VGRFSPYKNQLEMVGAFRQLGELHAAGWQYSTVGAVEEAHREGKLYYDAVSSMASDFPVHALANMELPKLRALYQQSKIFWHAAGYAHDEERTPHVMEHFGIVTVEAMAAGCVPIVINKGGQPEIVEHGVSGFLWNTLEELKGYTSLLARDDQLRQTMAEAARRRADLFSHAMYVKRFYELAPRLAP